MWKCEYSNNTGSQAFVKRNAVDWQIVPLSEAQYCQLASVTSGMTYASINLSKNLPMWLVLKRLGIPSNAI